MEFSPRYRNTDSWDEPFAPASTKLRLMCSYGGHIAQRPHDKSYYDGGDTRIIVAERATSFADLSTRLSKTFLNGRPFTLKYQLPNEDLDSLISVTTDEDLENMIGEYDLTTAAVKPSRIRLFLFPTKPDSTHSIPPQILNTPAKSDDWFLNASLSMDINGPYTSRALPPPQSQSLGNLQQRLQTLLEGARESWTHAIFWHSSYDSSSASILYWGDGYYKGEDDERKGKAPKTTSSSVEHAHRDTELFFLVSMTYSFVNGIGLPGQAFFNSSPVWVAGPDRLSELACERARQGLVYGLQTLVCIPCANGVVELGSTEVILPNPDLMNRVRLLFNPDFWISPNNPMHEPPPIKLLRKDIRLREREDTETQNCVNNILSMQSRGKEKISDSKCSWSLLSESSDGDTDSTFSRSDVYSGPS